MLENALARRMRFLKANKPVSYQSELNLDQLIPHIWLFLATTQAFTINGDALMTLLILFNTKIMGENS